MASRSKLDEGYSISMPDLGNAFSRAAISATSLGEAFELTWAASLQEQDSGVATDMVIIDDYQGTLSTPRECNKDMQITKRKEPEKPAKPLPKRHIDLSHHTRNKEKK